MSGGLHFSIPTFWCCVAKLMPRSLVYWCGIRILSEATTGQYSSTEVPALGATTALLRFKDASL